MTAVARPPARPLAPQFAVSVQQSYRAWGTLADGLRNRESISQALDYLSAGLFWAAMTFVAMLMLQVNVQVCVRARAPRACVCDVLCMRDGGDTTARRVHARRTRARRRLRAVSTLGREGGAWRWGGSRGVSTRLGGRSGHARAVAAVSAVTAGTTPPLAP